MGTRKKSRSDDKYVVPALEQALRVLFRMAQAESAHMNLTEICEEVGMHKRPAGRQP